MKIRTIITAAAAPAALAAVLLTTSAASAAPPPIMAAAAVTAPAWPALTSANWAGYYTLPQPGHPMLGASVTFTVPKVDCRYSRGAAPYYGGMWAGVGGLGSAGPRVEPGGRAWLEQAGVRVDCASKSAQAVYQPFWEVVPTVKTKDPDYAGSQVFRDAHGRETYVRPGDRVTVLVVAPAANGSNSRAWGFQVLVRDQNGRFAARWHHDKVLPRGVYTGRTAEVITEWPAGYAYGSWVLGSSGLVNTGAVQYDHADYTSTVKGDPKQEAFPVPGAPVILTHNGRVAIYPSAPYQAADSAMPDAFTTRYGPNWWK